MLFDGQHKAAAQLFLGNRYLYLRVFVNQLRKKIETKPSSPTYLLTEPWAGYRFYLPPETAPGTAKLSTRIGGTDLPEVELRIV